MRQDEQLVVQERPSLGAAELLTAQFYDWERRGRGWQVWDYPVELEPPYRPFFHLLGPIGPVSDDARKHTTLSAFVERLRDSFVPRLQPSPPVAFEIPEPEPEADSHDSPLVEVQVSVPLALKVTREAAEQFLLGLTYATGTVSFEVVGTPEATVVQLTCREEDLPQLRDQLRAHFPETVLREEPGFLRGHWEAPSSRAGVIVDFGLSREFMCPLRTFRGFEADPLSGTVGALAGLEDGEIGLVQVLFQAARYPWAESIVRSVTDGEGRAFFVDAPEVVSFAREKIARPLFACVVRVAAQSPVPGRAWGIAKALGGSLTPFSVPSSNELIPLENDCYDEIAHESDLLARQTHRSGMLLNSEELVSLVHLPSASVRSEKLRREERKTRAAPRSFGSSS